MKHQVYLVLLVGCLQAPGLSADFLGLGLSAHSGRQSYAVNGTLLCGKKPAEGVLVKLVDEDFGPNPDELLDSAETDEDGYFYLSGDTMEGTTIDPHLKIYHDCLDTIAPCQRKIKFELPNKYITGGRVPKKVCDIGLWNLEGEHMGEERDCIH